MSNVFGLEGARIVDSSDEVFRLFADDREALDEYFRQIPRSTHDEVDLRLIDKIDAILEPLLGSWEEDGVDSWWHRIESNDDGVRTLLFELKSFPPGVLPQLQAQLTGEHGRFCVFCTFFESLDDELEPIGRAAVFSDKALLNRALADALTSPGSND